MAGAAIQVEGADELRRVLRRAADTSLPKQLAVTNKAAALLVANRALPNVPVRSGKLRRSVRALGSQRVGRVAAGSARVPYGPPIHWGRKTGNVGSPPGNRRGRNPIKGRPFLWDAAEAMRGRVATLYERDISRLIDHAVRGAR